MILTIFVALICAHVEMAKTSHFAHGLASWQSYAKRFGGRNSSVGSSCGPGFESLIHYQYFYVVNFCSIFVIEKRTKI